MAPLIQSVIPEVFLLSFPQFLAGIHNPNSLQHVA